MLFRGRVVASWGVLVGALGLAACSFPRPVDQEGDTLTVHVVGVGSVSGGGLDCSTGDVGVCTIAVEAGTAVALTRTVGTVGAGSQVLLGAWGDDCASAGVGASCTVVVEGERTVSAAFTLQHRLELTVAAGGTGQGQLTATPGTLACATGTCSAFFDAGAAVTVAAAPATALDLATSVSGACGALPCALTMDGPRAVTSSFTRVACVPSSTSCAGGRFNDCDATGNYVSYDVPNGGADGSPVTLVMDDYLCPLGCHASGTRCNDISTSLDAIMDTPEVSPAGIDLVLPRSASIPPGGIAVTTFDATLREATIIDADGQALRVPAEVLSQGGLIPDVLVLKVRSFSLRSGSELHATGMLALAVASHFDIVVSGVIDLSSKRVGGSGAGAVFDHPICSGIWDVSGSMSSGGGAGVLAGGDGATPGTAGQPRVFGLALVGGCDSRGGAGGGAVKLVSRFRVQLASTGGIDVSGSGGLVFGPHAFGGGGGGMVFLAAPLVRAAAGAFLAGRGGSGAATNSDGSVFVEGNNGPRGNASALSVTCSGCGTSGAGDGGAAVGHAGGGGGLGGSIISAAVAANAAAMWIVGTNSPLQTR